MVQNSESISCKADGRGRFAFSPIMSRISPLTSPSMFVNLPPCSLHAWRLLVPKLCRFQSSDPLKFVLNVFPHLLYHSLLPKLGQKLLHLRFGTLSLRVDRVYPTSNPTVGSSCNGNSTCQRHPRSCISTRARWVFCARCEKYVTLASLYSRHIDHGP
jgi:hypothetical protein